jgi:outer membrane immunogenic protein
MKKSLILAACAASLMVAPAVAADVSVPKRPDYYAPVPVVGWTGFYAGVNAGWGLGSNNTNGALGGVQAGYNWQLGNWVFGPEADFQFSGQHGSLATNYAGVPAVETTRVLWQGSVRARAGYLLTSQLLLYGTGGFTYGEGTRAVSLGAAPYGTYSAHVVEGGWTAGGGLEYLLDTKWSAKVEYLHSYVHDFRNDNTLRLGVNYHF